MHQVSFLPNCFNVLFCASLIMVMVFAFVVHTFYMPHFVFSCVSSIVSFLILFLCYCLTILLFSFSFSPLLSHTRTLCWFSYNSMVTFSFLVCKLYPCLSAYIYLILFNIYPVYQYPAACIINILLLKFCNTVFMAATNLPYSFRAYIEDAQIRENVERLDIHGNCLPIKTVYVNRAFSVYGADEATVKELCATLKWRKALSVRSATHLIFDGELNVDTLVAVLKGLLIYKKKCKLCVV